MTDGPLFRNTTFRTSIVVLLLTVLFDRLFWHQGLGLNLALFAATAMLGSLLVTRRSISMTARVTLAGLVICATMVVVHGSVIAVVGALACLAVGAVLLLEPAQRNLPVALIGSLV